MAKSLYESILHGLFCILDVAENGHCDAVYTAFVPSNQRFKGSAISGQDPIDTRQVFVATTRSWQIRLSGFCHFRTMRLVPKQKRFKLNPFSRSACHMVSITRGASHETSPDLAHGQTWLSKPLLVTRELK